VHGVHLAVIDVLYKKLEPDADDEGGDLTSDEEGGGLASDEEGEDEDVDDENFILERNPTDACLPDLTHTYKSVIDTVRDVVKYFRHEKIRRLSEKPKL
jgi:hypothetical protein